MRSRLREILKQPSTLLVCMREAIVVELQGRSCDEASERTSLVVRGWWYVAWWLDWVTWLAQAASAETMLTFYQPPPEISRGDPQPRLGAELMESHVVPAYVHCCPTLTLETALLLLWCNPPLILCFPTPSSSCRSFEQNTSLRTFILR